MTAIVKMVSSVSSTKTATVTGPILSSKNPICVGMRTEERVGVTTASVVAPVQAVTTWALEDKSIGIRLWSRLAHVLGSCHCGRWASSSD